MLSQVNRISLFDRFFVHYKEHLLMFGYEGLPKDVHFTIAFNQDSTDINLHVTKNTERKDKPSLELLRINKNILKSAKQSLIQNMLHAMLEPLEMTLSQLYSRKRCFISLDNFRSGELYEHISGELETAFSPLCRLHGTRKLKMKGDLSASLRKVATSLKTNRLIYQSITTVPRCFNHEPVCGILVTQKKVITILRYRQRWYKLKRHNSLTMLLSHFIDPEVVKTIDRNIPLAIELVSKAESKADLAGIDFSIRLGINPPVNYT